MKPCARERGNSVLLSKAAVKVIQFVGKTSVVVVVLFGDCL